MLHRFVLNMPLKPLNTDLITPGGLGNYSNSIIWNDQPTVIGNDSENSPHGMNKMKELNTWKLV